MEICGGEGWERLCQFLDVPIPALPFPPWTSGLSVFPRLPRPQRKPGSLTIAPTAVRFGVPIDTQLPYNDPGLLAAKIREEAGELVEGDAQAFRLRDVRHADLVGLEAFSIPGAEIGGAVRTAAKMCSAMSTGL